MAARYKTEIVTMAMTGTFIAKDGRFRRENQPLGIHAAREFADGGEITVASDAVGNAFTDGDERRHVKVVYRNPNINKPPPAPPPPPAPREHF